MRKALGLWLLKRWARRRAAAAERARQLEQRRRQRASAFAALVLQLSCTASSKKEPRRVVERVDGGWSKSTLNMYVEKGDEATFRLNFRMSRPTFDLITEKLSESGWITTNKCRNKKYRMTAAFKVGVCLYFFAHGKSDAKVVGDVASLGKSTVELYLDQFMKGVLAVLRPIYMPCTPPSAENVEAIRKQFASRRGIANVAMAVDGTHIPFRGGPDYRNYKGWESILAVAFVNSYHLFVDADVGCAGRAGDNSVLQDCWLLRQIKANREAWLGKDGVIAADGGASDGGDLLLNPIPNASAADDMWYNFCHSSTRFFVEET